MTTRPPLIPRNILNTSVTKAAKPASGDDGVALISTAHKPGEIEKVASGLRKNRLGPFATSSLTTPVMTPELRFDTPDNAAITLRVLAELVRRGEWHVERAKSDGPVLVLTLLSPETLPLHLRGPG